MFEWLRRPNETDDTMTPEQNLDAKRQAAREYLGPRWILHPDYRFDPRHSTDPTIFVRARQPYLTKVIEAGAKARLVNPAFIH